MKELGWGMGDMSEKSRNFAKSLMIAEEFAGMKGIILDEIGHRTA